MSNTIRHYIGGTGRDGKHDWLPRIARDDQANGLKDHKRDRKVAKDFLKSGDGDDMPSGKRRTTATATDPTNCSNPVASLPTWEHGAARPEASSISRSHEREG